MAAITDPVSQEILSRKFCRSTPQPSVLATETPGPSGIGERSGRLIGKGASVMRVDAHVMCAYEVFTAWGHAVWSRPNGVGAVPKPRLRRARPGK